MKLSTIYLIICSSLLILGCQHEHKHSNQKGQNLDKDQKHREAHEHHNMDMKIKPTLIHTVFFWTNEGTTDEQMKAFEAGLEKLGSCPQIQTYFWGPPASTEKRDVVDNTYDYAINVHFASKEDQDDYQDEPIHQEFIENHKDLWAKVVVYDNEVR